MRRGYHLHLTRDVSCYLLLQVILPCVKGIDYDYRNNHKNIIRHRSNCLNSVSLCVIWGLIMSISLPNNKEEKKARYRMLVKQGSLTILQAKKEYRRYLSWLK